MKATKSFGLAAGLAILAGAGYLGMRMGQTFNPSAWDTEAFHRIARRLTDLGARLD